MRFDCKLIAVAAFLILCIGKANPANILAVFPNSSRSHHIANMAIIKVLLDRGHNITVVATVQLQKKYPNLHYIFIPPSERRLQEVLQRKSQITTARNKFQMMVKTMNIVLAIGPAQYVILKHPIFQDFLNNPGNKFDLVIVGYFFSDYLFGLGAHFDCPIVINWSSVPNQFVGRHVGNPPQLSYVSFSPLMGSLDALKFLGRVMNFMSAVLSSTIFAVMQMQMTAFYDELFPSPKYPSMEEAAKKVSLVLCNSHFSEGPVRPNVPALIEIGGVHIKEKPDPLPKDLQQILDGASEHGVIYVSFGFYIDSNDLRPEVRSILFKVLSHLPQTVLLKWNPGEPPCSSPNIHCREWWPQDDLLTHPNVRLFITHAGKGSISESQYHGVPMVAIPIFSDQPGNADQLARNGFGVQVDVFSMTEMTLKSAISEVLENSTYKDNVMKFSELYKDRPMTARESVAYWIEYVIRHKGAYHMQSPLVHLNSLQYLCIDVLAFLFVLMLIVLKLVKSIFRCLMSVILYGRRRKVKRN